MTLSDTLAAVQDLRLDFLPLPHVTEQELQDVHRDQLLSLGHLLELHTDDSTFCPSHFSLDSRHIRLLGDRNTKDS